MTDQTEQAALCQQILEKRDLLNKMVVEGINEEVIVLSQELDLLIRDYMLNQIVRDKKIAV